jgi:two-component system sensor histidine kinase QseC
MPPDAAASPRPVQPALWRHLWGWTLGALLVVWLTLVAVAWYTGHHEAEEITDGQLVAVARLWLRAAPHDEPVDPQPVGQSRVRAYVQDVALLQWDGARLVTDTHGMAHGLDLLLPPEAGFSQRWYSGAQGRSHWRMFVAVQPVDGHERRVAVLMDMAQRYDLGRDVALRVARPALLVLPLIALVLWWTIRRGLRPLEQLSSEVAALDGFAGQRLDDQHRFREFSSTVTAINTLVDTLQTRAQRERAFASDVAHELRTPLTALALQARAAQAEPTPARLAQIEQEALRAGRILAQLLDLARAQRNGADSQPVAIALGAVAAELISAHAQQAHESAHELALVQPEAPVTVRVSPMLLELALRNLLANALGHTPPGTQVTVTVWHGPQACGVSVSDDGQRPGAPAPDTPASQGLGLGLRLVERMAEQMGAELLSDHGEAPMTTRFTLRWPA